MSKQNGGSKPVPENVRAAFEAIAGLVAAFCRDHLNDEYAALCHRLTEKLARKRPSPLVSGKPATWACGIVRTIGWVNFLGDSTQTPHMKTADIDHGFGVSPASGAAKSKAIRDLLKMRPLDPDWTLPSRMDDNPLVWMLSVNGFLMDIRTAPREAQEVAFEKGLIPYIPACRAPEPEYRGREFTPRAQPGRKMSELLIEMSERLLRNPGVTPSSEAAHVALMFANFAWNETVGLDHPRTAYRPAWEHIEASNPELWGELKSNDVDALIDELVRYKREHFPHDRRRILTCGIPNGNVRVEWLPPAAPGVDSKAEVRLYGLVRTGAREQAVQFLQETRHLSRPEAVKQVQKIASDLGLR